MTNTNKPLVATTPMQHSVQGTWHAHTCPALTRESGEGCTCLWVWIERTADPDDDRGPDLFFGPWPAGSDHLAVVMANESLLIEGELQPPLGGTECAVVPDSERAANPRHDVILLDFDSGDDLGFDRHASCKRCGHGIVRLANYTDETWIAPDAGYDSVDGDGIWRMTCPDNDESIFAPHEPEVSA